MVRIMDGDSISSRSAGVNQSGVRDHNERLLLSILNRHRSVPAAELARRTGLSKPTVSTILRNLEADGLIRRGTPLRGRVGKPSIPIELDPDGAFSIGLKVGRKSADLLLLEPRARTRLGAHLLREPLRCEAARAHESLRVRRQRCHRGCCERRRGRGGRGWCGISRG